MGNFFVNWATFYSNIWSHRLRTNCTCFKQANERLDLIVCLKLDQLGIISYARVTPSLVVIQIVQNLIAKSVGIVENKTFEITNYENVTSFSE